MKSGNSNTATVYHPCLDEDGKRVVIGHPMHSTDASTWTDASAIATASVTDVSRMPASLFGTSLAPFTAIPETVEGWCALEPGMALDEPSAPDYYGLRMTSGCVVIEPDNRIWLVHPSNKFAGVETTFPKGRLDAGLSLLVNAVKETVEESGLWVQPVAYLCDVVRTLSVTRFYVARRIAGDPRSAGWESQAVSLVPIEALPKELNRPNDRKVIPFINDWIAKHPDLTA